MIAHDRSNVGCSNVTGYSTAATQSQAHESIHVHLLYAVSVVLCHT